MGLARARKMNRDSHNAATVRQTRSAVALFAVIGAIIVVALAVFIGLILRFGSLDSFFEYVIRAALQARFDRLVEARSLWPWSFWMFFWGFVTLLIFVLLVVLYVTLLERKLLGWFQIRLGPNRVGPWGLLQPFADMVKLLVKEDIVPRAADKWLHLIAPLIIFIPTLLAFVAIPFGAGTVELPQQLVAPTFDRFWVEWVSTEDAPEKGLAGQGWLEAPVTIEENEEFHKTWWTLAELDGEPRFIQADDNGVPMDRRYRNPVPLVLQVKPENPADEPIYANYFLLTDYASSGRAYDVLELRWGASSGHGAVVELGLQGDLIDRVEAEYTDMLNRTGSDVPPEEQFDFEDRPVRKWLDELFARFAESVGVNNRSFGPASMVPAFRSVDEGRVTWRDIYTSDSRHSCVIHGSVDRDERKASLYFFPAPLAGRPVEAQEFNPDEIDWLTAGASFRLQRATGGGYTIESADGAAATLSAAGDSTGVVVGDEPVTLTLKNAQYYTVYLMGKDLGIGIVYILAVTSLSVLGIFMAGFGSNNKWSLYGAVRSAAQLMSYEIPMTLAVLGPVLIAGSLSTTDLVESQGRLWFVIPQFLAFYVFMVCMTSEVNRTPFDLPEAESELVAGFHTEYSGLKFGFFFLAEYANMFLASAIMVILFFGGWKGPFVVPYIGEFVSGFVWFMLKAWLWLCIFIWFRATFPRFRIDQMMDYAWKVLLPIALGNIVVTGYFAFSDVYYHKAGLRIWQENNWRIWELYVKPLFVNTYTNYFAIPVIVIFAILFLTDAIGVHQDHRRERSASSPRESFPRVPGTD